VRCGKGTYIRSLARDLGERLGCGALVAALERTRIGNFDIRDALGLHNSAVQARARLLPALAAVGHLPKTTLAADDLQRLRHGQILNNMDVFPIGDIAVLDAGGELRAIARSKIAGTLKARKWVQLT